MAKIGHSKSIQTTLVRKYLKSCKTAKIGHSESILTTSVGKYWKKLQNGKNLPYQNSCHLKTIRQNNQKSNQDILGINMNIQTKYEVSVTIYVGRRANQRKSTITSAI